VDGNNEKYGGGFKGTIQGWHGEYDLQQGFFSCLSQDTTQEAFKVMIADFFASEYMSSSTRAIILTFTSYNVPSQYYTAVNLLFEQSSAGYIDANFIAFDPFKTPL